MACGFSKKKKNLRNNQFPNAINNIDNQHNYHDIIIRLIISMQIFHLKNYFIIIIVVQCFCRINS